MKAPPDEVVRSPSLNRSLRPLKPLALGSTLNETTVFVPLAPFFAHVRLPLTEVSPADARSTRAQGEANALNPSPLAPSP